mgnify:FL=1|jgi:hypothetical protein
MLTRLIALVALLGLTACEQTSRAVDNAARNSAKVAVNEALVTRFPLVPKELTTPFTDCVIDNASANEIGELARDAVIGVTDTTAALVRTVLERPETQQCVIRAGATVLDTL